MKNFHFSGNSTPMKKSIILISALSMLALMLVSCSSEPETTTTTTRQTTTTNAAENRMSQPIGYRDMRSGEAALWVPRVITKMQRGTLVST
jgi:uncharacterized lipoprotein YajG